MPWQMLAVGRRMLGSCITNCFSPFPINQTIRDRWMRLMENALGEASLPSKAEEVLRKFFNEMSTFMINQSEAGIS
jgi:truncated hemoglobin YjbI